MTDLFDQLQGRKQPTVELAIPQDPAGWAAAVSELEEAEAALREAQTRGRDLGPLAERVEVARSARDGQPVIEFTIRALPAGQWDDLVAQHPPTGEQRKAGWQWNAATFRPALLAEVVEPAMTENQWHVVTERGQLGLGELDMLFAEAVNLSNRAPRLPVGKG